MAELSSALKLHKVVDAFRRFLESAASVSLFPADCASESVRCVGPFRIIFELILVPELLEHGTTLVRITMTEEDFLARLRRIGLLCYFYIATLR